MGVERASSRSFLDGAEAIAASMSLIEEARALHAEPLKLPLGAVADIRPLLDRALKGGLLDPRELLSVNNVLFAFERARATLEERRARLPAMAELGNRLPDLEKLATRLERAIEPSGELSDRASPALKEARDRAKGLHRSIQTRLDRMLEDESFSQHLRESYVSLRNDRYVIPVLTQSRNQVPGIVHNASQSGQTLFVEPQELIGLGNDLAIAQSEVLEEERKVLLEFTHQLAREASGLKRGVEALAILDEAEGAAFLSDDMGAVVPELQPPTGELRLKGLCHPLLKLRGVTVVGNDVEVRAPSRVMVISGPNAGGKTVTLTGTGLCALMVRAGLPIPVQAGSTLPLFTSVQCAMGDAQDMAAGLSTFSAHVSTLRDICAKTGAGALVLIDEIAADTDPKEGAAIAIAVLEALINTGAQVLVTTHLEELKALAQLDSRFVNARVGFDSKKMAPNYRLQLGAAGASSAIEIARRVGLPEGICQRAGELVANSGSGLAKALAAAEQERQQLYDAKLAAQKELDGVRAERAALAAELEQHRGQRLEQERKFRQALKGELEFARSQIGSLLASLAKEPSRQVLTQAASEVAARIDDQLHAERKLEVGEAIQAEAFQLRAGARAWANSLNTDVELLELDGEEALVAAGALKMRLKVAELSRPRVTKAAPGPTASERMQRAMSQAEEQGANVLTSGSPSVNVRGMRVDEAIGEVEKKLDRALQSGEREVLIVHGHGTGALKQAIREYLERCAYVQGFRAGDRHEGGPGVTVATLR
ncbi:MAG: Smr/MutS family protein [Myxococcaceae bacterium]|nr:Smr/MutS family protein [Myxococcaceae bacterium]